MALDEKDEIGDDAPPDAEFLQGIKEFNARQFFDCHETLEAVWKKTTSPRREFIQGIIQAAVAFYHLDRGNLPGAIKLFRRALPRLQKFGGRCYGVDAFALASQIACALSTIESDNPEAEQKLPEPPQIEISL
jgi:predicted metal-dependent hydrolase